MESQCTKGHNNWLVRKSGKRECRTCKNEYDRNYKWYKRRGYPSAKEMPPLR